MTSTEQPSGWEEVVKVLSDFYDPAEVARWVKTPNEQLHGLTPEKAWKTPEGRERVREIVNEMGDGLYI